MKFLKEWLHKRKKNKDINQYVKGYNYAAGEILRGVSSPIEIESHYYGSSWTPFDRGCDDAIDLLTELKVVEDNRM